MRNDFFICHATEDKEAFVRTLAHELNRKGAKVWYDEFSLSVGDSLRDSVDRGMSASKYGLVILSKNFFKKQWTIRELNGLTAREMIEKRKIVLPIWLDVNADDVCHFSPALADKFALTFDGDYTKLVTSIMSVINSNTGYVVLSGKQNIAIHDAKGEKSTWSVERTYRTFDKPITEIELQRIISDGSIIPVSTSSGVLDSISLEGGYKNLIARFPDPIKPNTVFAHTIIFDQTKTFYARDLEVSVTPVWPYEKYSIAVNLPRNYKFSDAIAYKRIGKEKIPADELKVGHDVLQLDLANLEIGVSYYLAWKCLDHTSTPGI